ncbi:MAG: FkbM family methyltransferase [Candidatus Omnitrophica bacterium]|nr:FkbM family methyltransferase [Candidatus Omnitrophota bacterium]
MKHWKRTILKSLIHIMGLDKASVTSCSVAEEIQPIYKITRNQQTFVFSCPNSTTRWRMDTYFSKEPATIEWLDSMKPGEVFFNIGANIGLYSIYAAKQGVKVIAFEPESQNYALLNKNIFLNQCADSVTALNIALAREETLGYLYMPSFEAGAALNQFNQQIDEQGKTFSPVYKQGMISMTLDNFVNRYQLTPDHIKIDVDGIEEDIIQGAAQVLKNTRLKSLLVEINESLAGHQALIKKIEDSGLMLIHKQDGEKIRQGQDKQVFNYLFRRKI